MTGSCSRSLCARAWSLPFLVGTFVQAICVGAAPLRGQALRRSRPLELPYELDAVEGTSRRNDIRSNFLSLSYLFSRYDNGLDPKGKTPANHSSDADPGCFKTHHADATGDHLSWCPKSCPYRVEATHEEGFCNFQCVATAEQCVEQNPRADVADDNLGICRRCAVWGCEKCARVGSDTCGICADDWWLSSSGECIWKYRWFVRPVIWVIGLIVLIIVYWAADLTFRPTTNARGLRRGLLHRSWSKIRRVALTPTEAYQRADDSFRAEEVASNSMQRQPSRVDEAALATERTLWPMTTNLMREDVAGPGMVLHFNFQAAMILWALVILISWTVLAHAVDTDLLFKLGTQEAQTPHMYCVLVAWGLKRTVELRFERLSFVFCAYVFTCLFALILAVHQRGLYERLDYEEATMKDYAILCQGLPEQSGEEKAEEEFRDFIKDELNTPVVGISMCWVVGEEAVEPVADALADSLDDMKQAARAKRSKSASSLSLDASLRPRPDGPDRGDTAKLDQAGEADSDKGLGPRRLLLGTERLILRKFCFEKPSEERLLSDVPNILRGLKTSGWAYVIFETERGRNAALKAVEEKGGLQYRGCTITMQAAVAEPQTVLWRNFAGWNTLRMGVRIAGGCVCILVALLIYSVVIFLPTASAALYFFPTELDSIAAHAHWLQFSQAILGIVIVLGNQVNYFLCAFVAEKVGFRYTDSREAAYMAWYLLSCLIAMGLDFWLQYNMRFAYLDRAGIRTYDGKTFGELTSFRQGFEAYAMQKDLGSFLWYYQIANALSYLPEPLGLIFLPYHFGKSLVRSHVEVQGVNAENLMMCMPTDLGRYADVLLNVLIAILIFLFPAGYTLQMFALLVVVNIYIYCYDHIRILKYTLQCAYTNRTVEVMAQYLLAIPCGLLLAIYIFKSRCTANHLPEMEEELEMAGQLGCRKGPTIFLHCLVALMAHCIVHWFILINIVPRVKRKFVGNLGEEPRTDEPYSSAAKRLPFTWFTSNDVHCLRSSYIYKQKPSCSYCVVGKEHLMQVSKETQCFFEAAEPASDEETEWMTDFKDYICGAVTESNEVDGKKTPTSSRSGR